MKGASYVYGDNMSVVTNSSKPELTLKKKSNLFCYHAVHEAVAMGKALVAHIPTKKNLMLTCSPRRCMGRLGDFLSAGCSGMCSLERMCQCNQGEECG